MSNFDDPVPYWKQTQLVDDALAWFADAAKRDRAAAEHSRQVADAHREGWKLVAKAVNDGFRLVADAIRDSRR